MSTSETYAPGLEGVIAGETAISTVAGGLRYRGYPVVDLVGTCSFEEVAHLLLHGELPTKTQLDAFNGRLSKFTLPDAVAQWLRIAPAHASGMDIVRTAVSMLALHEANVEDSSKEANMRKSEALLAQIPLIIAEWDRARRKLAPLASKPQLGIAGNLLYLLRGKEAEKWEKDAFEVTLILYAEHEFNASTFTARVVTSTEADMHAAIVAAISALKGRLHGGANERVMDVLRAAGGPTEAERWIRGALARKDKIMGFGHRVYKTGDVRAGILKEVAKQASQRLGLTAWEDTAQIIEDVIAKEKNLFPNLDWPAGRLYFALGLEVSLYTPFFVASRVTGWCAHVMEQAENNRLMRPRGRYIGADERKVTPLAERISPLSPPGERGRG